MTQGNVFNVDNASCNFDLLLREFSLSWLWCSSILCASVTFLLLTAELHLLIIIVQLVLDLDYVTR